MADWISNGEAAFSIRSKLNALKGIVDSYATSKADVSALNALTTTVNTKADLSEGKLVESQIPSYVKTDSYLAWVTNANTTALDVAFGKNNDNLMRFLGHQLAMYSWFKGDSSTTYPYTNLKTKSTFAEILANSAAYNEIRNNINLFNLIVSSPYAQSVCRNVLPLVGTIPCAQSVGSFVTVTGINQLVQQAIITTAGYYNIRYVITNTQNYQGYYANLYVNSIVKQINSTNGSKSYSQYFNKGDVVEIRTGAEYSSTVICSPMYICTLRDVVYPTTPNAGNRIVLYNTQYVYSMDSDTAGELTRVYVPNAGTYRVNAYIRLAAGGTRPSSISLVKNGVAVNTWSSSVTTNQFVSYDVACNANDYITIAYTNGNGGTDHITLMGFSVGIAATDDFPA